MFFEGPHRRPDETGDDVVGVVTEDHGIFQKVGAEPAQVLARFDFADQLVDVLKARHFAQDPRRLEDAVTTCFGLDGELVAGEVDFAVADPVVESRLGEEDAVISHSTGPVYHASISVPPRGDSICRARWSSGT